MDDGQIPKVGDVTSYDEANQHCERDRERAACDQWQRQRREMTNLNRAVAAVALAVAILSIGNWCSSASPDAASGEVAASTAADGAQERLRTGVAQPQPSIGTTPLTTSATAPAALSLSERVRALSASGDPRDAFTGYHILSQCRAAKEEERQYQQTRQAERDPDRTALVQAGIVGAKAIENACGDLQPWDFRDRLALVERAAEAGVPMAAVRFAGEGPWGDEQALYTRWDDPLVQEWRKKAAGLLQLAASKGDVTALNSLQAQYEDGAGLIAERNPELALRYAVAKHIVHQAQTGKPILGAKRELADMAAMVSTDVAARAQADGEAMAKEILGGKK
jgi:hypothetical protein